MNMSELSDQSLDNYRQILVPNQDKQMAVEAHEHVQQSRSLQQTQPAHHKYKKNPVKQTCHDYLDLNTNVGETLKQEKNSAEINDLAKPMKFSDSKKLYFFESNTRKDSSTKREFILTDDLMNSPMFRKNSCGIYRQSNIERTSSSNNDLQSTVDPVHLQLPSFTEKQTKLMHRNKRHIKKSPSKRQNSDDTLRPVKNIQEYNILQTCDADYHVVGCKRKMQDGVQRVFCTVKRRSGEFLQGIKTMLTTLLKIKIHQQTVPIEDESKLHQKYISSLLHTAADCTTDENAMLNRRLAQALADIQYLQKRLADSQKSNTDLTSKLAVLSSSCERREVKSATLDYRAPDPFFLSELEWFLETLTNIEHRINVDEDTA